LTEEDRTRAFELDRQGDQSDQGSGGENAEGRETDVQQSLAGESIGSALRRQLLPRQRAQDEFEIADQIAARHSLRLNRQPHQPLDSGVAHEQGGARHASRPEIELRAYPQHQIRVQTMPVPGDPDVLLRDAEPNEEDLGAARVYLFNDLALFFRAKEAVPNARHFEARSELLGLARGALGYPFCASKEEDGKTTLGRLDANRNEEIRSVQVLHNSSACDLGGQLHSGPIRQEIVRTAQRPAIGIVLGGDIATMRVDEHRGSLRARLKERVDGWSSRRIDKIEGEKIDRGEGRHDWARLLVFLQPRCGKALPRSTTHKVETAPISRCDFAFRNPDDLLGEPLYPFEMHTMLSASDEG
jgi:hypothetical protein